MYRLGTCVYCAGWCFAEVRWRDVMNLILPTFSRKKEGGEGEGRRGEGKREGGRWKKRRKRRRSKEGKKERKKEGKKRRGCVGARRQLLCACGSVPTYMQYYSTYIHAHILRVLCSEGYEHVSILCVHSRTYIHVVYGTVEYRNSTPKSVAKNWGGGVERGELQACSAQKPLTATYCTLGQST